MKIGEMNNGRILLNRYGESLNSSTDPAPLPPQQPPTNDTQGPDERKELVQITIR